MNTKNYVKPITMVIDMWRDVEGTPYEVSVMGEVRNRNTGYVKKQCDRGNGYYCVSFGHSNVHNVHSLIARAFPEICGEWFEGAEISHLDENPKNNCAFNLRYVDHKTNLNWGTRRTKAVASRLANGNYGQKPVIQYTFEDVKIKEYPSLYEAERQTGYFSQCISACARGKQKQAYGYKWKYMN